MIYVSKSIHLFSIFNFVECKCLIFMILWLSTVSVVMSPFSLLSLLIGIVCLCLLGNFNKAVFWYYWFAQRTNSLCYWYFALFFGCWFHSAALLLVSSTLFVCDFLFYSRDSWCAIILLVYSISIFIFYISTKCNELVS